jgi:hypothetical protein
MRPTRANVKSDNTRRRRVIRVANDKRGKAFTLRIAALRVTARVAVELEEEPEA